MRFLDFFKAELMIHSIYEQRNWQRMFIRLLFVVVNIITFYRLNSRQHVAKKAHLGNGAEWNSMAMGTITNNNGASSAVNEESHVRVIVTKQTGNDSGYVSTVY